MYVSFARAYVRLCWFVKKGKEIDREREREEKRGFQHMRLLSVAASQCIRFYRVSEGPPTEAQDLKYPTRT